MHSTDIKIWALLRKRSGLPVNEEDLVLTPEQIREDEEEQKILDSFISRKCDQCGDFLSVCIWSYPNFRNLPPNRRIMGCLIGPDDHGKNWWCGQCESFFE